MGSWSVGKGTRASSYKAPALVKIAKEAAHSIRLWELVGRPFFVLAFRRALAVLRLCVEFGLAAVLILAVIPVLLVIPSPPPSVHANADMHGH